MKTGKYGDLSAAKQAGKQVYNTPEYRRARLMAMKNANYVCEFCASQGDIIVSDLHCDHIIPLSKGGAPFDTENMQILCRTCHLNKTKGRSLRAHMINLQNKKQKRHGTRA